MTGVQTCALPISGNSTVVGAWRGNRILIGGYKGNWDVYVVNADGSGLAQLTTDPKDDTPSDWYQP